MTKTIEHDQFHLPYDQDQPRIKDLHIDDRDSSMRSPQLQIETPSQSQSRETRIRIKNRRMRYLELHPEYFDSGLELADPLLYDRLIRRFQTASERETDGRKKGYSGVLEADLYRSEAKLHALRHPDPNSLSSISYRRGKNGEILEAEDDADGPKTREEAREMWEREMGRRFIEGRDGDFEYGVVDGDEGLDGGVGEREEEERWFEGQTPEWVDAEEGLGKERVGLMGETGVQDF